jgi:hypothetical protein
MNRVQPESTLALATRKLAARAVQSPAVMAEKLKTASFSVSQKLFDGTAARFVGHSDYLAMNLPAGPKKVLLESLKATLGLKLKTRDDAHITVITPPEFAKLKSKLSMAEIERIATSAGLQSTPVKPLGLGMGSSGKDATFYVVMDAPGLGAVRRAIAEAYVAKGGSPNDFAASHYFPHVTVGFTSRDLHEADGVKKNQASIPNPGGLRLER